jgi:hypothetical protein
MIEKVRLWGDSAFEVGGTRKLRLRVPSPVARLYVCTLGAVSCVDHSATIHMKKPFPFNPHEKAVPIQPT